VRDVAALQGSKLKSNRNSLKKAFTKRANNKKGVAANAATPFLF
jgi:hypothetical protein